MKILHPNVTKSSIMIQVSHSYVMATDTKKRLFLKRIKIGPCHYTWVWVSLEADHFIDVSDIEDHFCSFDHAINRAVNDMYCTVYQFNNNEDMVKHWKEAVHKECITTIYSSEDK